MPQVVHRTEEEDISPLSASGVWRSIAVQLEVYKKRPAPTCAFLLALGTWIAAVYRMIRPESADPNAAGICIDPAALYLGHGIEWRRFLLHAFWPLEPGYLRGFFSSAALVILGYALEYELGTAHFAGLLLGIQFGTAFVLLHFRFSLCHHSLEAAIAGMTVVMHRANPKLHCDGLDKSLKLPFEVEPRWHMWALLSFLLLQAYNFPQAFMTLSAGLAGGAFCALREPEAWGDIVRSISSRSFTSGAAAHVALFVFSVMFMPLTVTEMPFEPLAAIADGRALRPTWWQQAVPSSPPLLHMAMSGRVAGEALYICKLLISFAPPLLLSSFRIWAKFYAVACFIIIMYAMNCESWRYPHFGFVTLAYLVFAFWKLPNAAAAVPKQRTS
eukprot:TRINITY_DN12566_c0_g1_i1.p1 TRINITY_DN12566_c0_g1~~TRINITY_DN12566_c0_g1_i1.p1  ORF type:complete len:386 (-),score=73.68 TRINITY_DN12566_c0_g1_i1:158-1315(-)